MKSVYALLLVLACALGCSKSSVDSKQRFTSEFSHGIAAAAPGTGITVTGPLTLKLVAKGGHEFTCSLDNAYAEYQQSPDRKEEIIKHYVATNLELLGQGGDSGPVDVNKIVPVIKDRAYLDGLKAQISADKFDVLYDEYNSELIVFYVEDLPQTMRYLVSKDLEEANVRRADLRALALKNLAQLMPASQIKDNDGVLIVSAGESYETSLILKDSMWNKDDFKIKGDIIIAVPARGLLMVTDSANQDNVDGMRTVGQKICKQGPYPLTPALFVYRNGKFEKYEK